MSRKNNLRENTAFHLDASGAVFFLFIKNIIKQIKFRYWKFWHCHDSHIGVAVCAMGHQWKVHYASAYITPLCPSCMTRTSHCTLIGLFRIVKFHPRKKEDNK